jgi:hypothetical protein
MRRAILAGADTIEHGYGGTAGFKLMHDRGTALCPTIAASKPSPLLEMTATNPRPKASRKTAARSSSR